MIKIITTMNDFQEDEAKASDEEKKSSSKKTKKTSNSDQLPALMDDADFTNKIDLIQKQISSIVERQNTGVSPEFSALMDGYVNKANESQTYRVKYEHLEAVHEELKLEAKTLREENRKLKSDSDASREALRLSEADLQRLKKDLETNKLHYDEQVSALVEEREKLKARVKQLNDEKEKAAQEYNDLKAELLEHKYKTKQLDQEKQVEIETHKRTVKEAQKNIDELKEKLDLRTREVEYKDALLNQLIKQVSADDAGKTMPQSAVKVDYGAPSSPFAQLAQAPLSEMPGSNPSPSAPAFQNSNKAGTKRSIELRLDDNSPSSEGSSWGAFRK